MDRFDAMRHVLYWVTGSCHAWNDRAKQFDANSREFQDFVHRTFGVVWRYINGNQTLDGSCSDLECELSINARHIFKIDKEGT